MMSKPPRHSGLMNAMDAARLLGVCHVTLRKWVRTGYLAGQLVGPSKRVRVRRADVLALKASWTVQPLLDFKKAAGADID